MFPPLAPPASRPFRRAGLVACAVVALCAAAADVAAAQKRKTLSIDPTSELLFKAPEVLKVELSPDGKRLAIGKEDKTGSFVTVNSWPEMKVLRTIKPGNVGAINTVRWLDDARLLIGTDADFRIDKDGITIAFPSVFVVPVAGGKATQMPANFLATIDGDPNHLLVTRCTRMVDGDCVLEIFKVATGPDAGPGERVMEAPDSHCTVITDDRGLVRMAIGWNKDGQSRTWISADGKAWTLVNEEARSGVTMYPLGTSADGKSGFVQTERLDGTDVVERFDFATRARTEVQRAEGSDPIETILATDVQEPIGAWYDQTRPQPRFWNPKHPHAQLLVEAQAAFPGKKFELTSTSADAQRAVLAVSDDREPGAFYLYDRATRKPALVARSRPWLVEARMATTRELDLRARDGLPLKGLLTLPHGSAGKAMPTVVLVHGGPYWIADAWGFNEETQLLAQHGFAVLQVNFRGSSGYGKPFMDKGMRQWGRAMQDDVTDATRWAIAEGIADPARVCIYGASYGAYAALMGAAREPDLYRCAAGLAGIYDLKKMYKWSTLRRSDLGRGFLHRALGTDEAQLAASSPMQLADRIKADVLLAHGKLDDTSDIRFAKAMQKALNKARERDVELVVYDDQGHSFDDMEAQGDFYARLLKFLHASLDRAPVAASE